MNNLVFRALLSIIFCTLPICLSQNTECVIRKEMSGIISISVDTTTAVSKCWRIKVPKESYARLQFKEFTFYDNQDCSKFFVRIFMTVTDLTFTFCKRRKLPPTLNAFHDAHITYNHGGGRMSNSKSSFHLNYSIESVVCREKSSFRCSYKHCIAHYQVCDGVVDCENGADEFACEKGISGVRGMNDSRENAVTWLMSRRSASFGWGKNTHRAITALHLTDAYTFRGQDLEEEVMVKQLELQTLAALLRNSTDSMSVNELNMFVNALTVTCHNPRQFYGHDLLQILRQRVSVLKSPSPGAYLALCYSNFTITESDVEKLLRPLHNHSNYPFVIDIQAMAVMALTCAKNKTDNFRNITNADNIYEEAIEQFIAGQHPDGSFGNVYTTALVTQALISSGQQTNKKWNMTATAQYLMQQLKSSSVDFLSTYLTLPIFNSRSLVDISDVDCSNMTRKQEEDNEISDVKDKLGDRMRIQYSLFIGDKKEVIHTLFLMVPHNSTAYDVMNAAQVIDPKYTFLYRDVSGQKYVYKIAGITNDPEAGKYWLLYTGDSKNETVKHHIISPDEFSLENSSHLIMWYKTIDII